MMLKTVLVTGISAQFADCEGIVRVIIVEATVADRVLCILLTTMKIHGFSRWLSGKKKKIHLPMQEMRVWSLGQEDSQEEEMVTHSSILAWKIPWTG